MKEDRFDRVLKEHTERVQQCVRDNPDLNPPIRDASTLILLKWDGETPRVLMGKRSSAHVFMPDVYVFPGGRVDAGDESPVAISELEPTCDIALSRQSKRPARAFPLTAIRETLEETGLVVGRAEQTSYDAPDNWRPYFDQGAVPDLKKLSFLGRAVTPPGNTRRFDTRFMIADADDVLIDDRSPMDGAELSDLNWLTLEDAQDAKLPIVTHFVLRHLHKQLSRTPDAPDRFHWRWNTDRFDVDDI